MSILEPQGRAEASEDSSGDEAETSPDKNGSLNSDKEDKEARKERKRLKRESKEKRREERRKKKLLKNQEILFKMVEGLYLKVPLVLSVKVCSSSRSANYRGGRGLLRGQNCSEAN